MGNCCTGCWSTCVNHGALCNFKLQSSPTGGDFAYLVEDVGISPAHQSNQRNFISRIFGKRRNKPKLAPSGIMQGILKPQLSYHRLSESQRVLHQSSYIKKDIQLQCLDARALLRRTSISTQASTPDNSLDLEWEHETLPVSSLRHDPSASSWATSILPESTLASQMNHNAYGLNTTDSDCSRVSSSVNSLEWDSVHNSIQSEVDTVDMDTQFLLNEIDRLTFQALNETGIVVDDVGYMDEAL